MVRFSRRGQRRPDRAGDTGVATVEFVLAVPVLLFCVLLVIQFGLWAHAAHVAQAAAQEGARSARVEMGTEAAGEERAKSILSKADGVVSNARVDVMRTDDVARVEVEGTAVAVVPGIDLPVRAVSSGPVERFRGTGERP